MRNKPGTCCFQIVHFIVILRRTSLCRFQKHVHFKMLNTLPACYCSACNSINSLLLHTIGLVVQTIAKQRSVYNLAIFIIPTIVKWNFQIRFREWKWGRPRIVLKKEFIVVGHIKFSLCQWVIEDINKSTFRILTLFNMWIRLVMICI